MGGFFLVRHDVGAASPALLACLQESFSRQEFDEPRKIDRPDYSLRLYRKRNAPNENYVSMRDGAFAFSVGTFIYRESIGHDALTRFLKDFDPDNIRWSEIYGHFCIGISKGAEFYLFTDRQGIYKVYCDSALRVFSSSFLGALASLKSSRISVQGVYEYVFRGGTYGNKTVIEEIDIVGSDSMLRFSDGVTDLPHKKYLRQDHIGGSLDDHVRTNLSNVRRFFSIIAKCFGSNVATALSGGYDSRFILGLLLEQGVEPYVYVYGKEDSPDVRIAKQIAAGERLSLEHIDRDGLPKLPIDAFAGIVKRNFFAFDGCPDKGIFDNGSDLATRLGRSSGGKLVLNGGGGEVFRIFFPIADVRLSVEQFLRRCYGDFDPSLCTSLFSGARYLKALEAKVNRVRGKNGSVLERAEIEYLYPAFRCRFWMAQGNSIDSGITWYLTPFVDHNIVRDAVNVPLRYKRHGSFEARMMREVSPTLAGYPSVYGHDFLHGVSWQRRVGDMATTLRKTYLPFINAHRLRTLLSQRAERSLPYYLQTEYTRSVMDPTFPYLTQLFGVGEVTDKVQYARICTLEYLFQTYQPKPAAERS